jgi:hypothetical protein
MQKKNIWRGVIGVAVLIAATFCAWVIPYNREVARRDARMIAFGMMVQALSPAEAAAESFVKDQGTLGGIEAAERGRLPSDSEGVEYFVLHGGILVGISYETQVTVVLTPDLAGGKLSWRCLMAPKSQSPPSCRQS